MSLLNELFFFNTLRQPWLLLLLIGVALLFLVELFTRAPGTLSISTGETLRRIQGSRPGLMRRLPAVLRALGLALLVLALARPMYGYQLRKDRADVVDIMLCVDVSGSMRQQDFTIGGAYRDRLYVTKLAVQDFIESRKERGEDRYGLDRLGLVLYAGYAWTQCPLTLDYEVLERELAQAHIDERDPNKQGTAIGSALGLAVRRLSKSESKSKVIVLLTDGLNNRGELDPITAAQVAKEYGVRVYTIGAGTTQGGLTPQPGLLLGIRGTGIDEESMKQIAETTGGRYYRATDTQSLHEAYAEINELERTEIEVGDYYEYEEAFVPYAVLGGLLLMGSIFSRRRWFEPIP
jgi:Ca-activated chloride channel family protein